MRGTDRNPRLSAPLWFWISGTPSWWAISSSYEPMSTPKKQGWATGGQVIRTLVDQIRVAGRNTQGVRVIRLTGGEHVKDVAPVAERDDEHPNNQGRHIGPDTDPPA